MTSNAVFVMPLIVIISTVYALVYGFKVQGFFLLVTYSIIQDIISSEM